MPLVTCELLPPLSTAGWGSDRALVSMTHIAHPEELHDAQQIRLMKVSKSCLNFNAYSIG